MFKLYNNNFVFSTFNFNSLFSNVDSSLSKNQKNFLSDFFTSLISSNSVNFDKIASILFYKYDNINFDSILKRISRFLNNKNYNFHSLFDNVIKYVISNYKVKHNDVEPNRAKRYYSYRFGSIETIFKNQKSNGFNLEKTGLKSLHAFDNLYSLVCIGVIFLTCLGIDISKNSKCHKNLGFKAVKKTKDGKFRRVLSLFQATLRLFKLFINSNKHYRVPFTFKLYDV